MSKMIDIRDLKKGTRILVETVGEVYELTVGTPERCVVLLASDKRFEQRDKAVLLDSFHYKTGHVVPHMIGEDWCMRLKPRKRFGINFAVITTGPAERATMTVDNVTTELWNIHAQYPNR